MTNNVRSTFSVGDITWAIYNYAIYGVLCHIQYWQMI